MPQLKPTRGICLNKSHLFSRGLDGFWLLNEGSGGIVFDSSGSGYTGTLFADTHFVAGKFGGALDFDGNADFVEIPNLLAGKHEFSIVFNVNVTNGLADRALYGCWGIGGEREILLFYENDPAGWRVILFDSGSNLIDTGQGTPAIAFGNDVQIAITYHSSQGLFLYENGVIIASQTDVNGLPLLIDSSFFPRFGLDTDDTKSLLGLLNYVMIYNRALFAFEMALLCLKPFVMFEDVRSPKVVVTVPVPVAAVSHAVGFRPIEGADRLRGLRRSAFY